MTVGVARDNMAALLGPALRTGFVAEDARLADVMDKHVSADITYLSNERERRFHISTGPTRALRAAPTFGLVTAMPEEYAAMLHLVQHPQSMPVAGDRAQRS